jgi:hypothetical protein
MQLEGPAPVLATLCFEFCMNSLQRHIYGTQLLSKVYSICLWASLAHNSGDTVVLGKMFFLLEKWLEKIQTSEWGRS